MRHLLFLFMLAGCGLSHGLLPDASSDGGTDARVDATCLGGVPTCVEACGGTQVDPVCGPSGAYTCPPGSIDASECGCDERDGILPRPGCACIDNAWVCEGPECPADLRPREWRHPANACRVEGATCSNGDNVCGAALFCTCDDGFWNCAVAEPDPVCWCERQPMVGDPCVDESTSCGQCCPTPGDGPESWPAMQCDGGQWRAADCPDIECPFVPVPVVCPVNTADSIGGACDSDGAICGNACCGTAISCRAGVWERGPEADCLCMPDRPCGTGSCPDHQYCHDGCGPDDGPIYSCRPMPECRSCECLDLMPWQACEMRDGAPYVSEFCG